MDRTWVSSIALRNTFINKNQKFQSRCIHIFFHIQHFFESNISTLFLFVFFFLWNGIFQIEYNQLSFGVGLVIFTLIPFPNKSMIIHRVVLLWVIGNELWISLVSFLVNKSIDQMRLKEFHLIAIEICASILSLPFRLTMLMMLLSQSKQHAISCGYFNFYGIFLSFVFFLLFVISFFMFARCERVWWWWCAQCV